MSRRPGQEEEIPVPLEELREDEGAGVEADGEVSGVGLTDPQRIQNVSGQPLNGKI